MYTIKGEIKVIKKEQQISDSFKKREFVLTVTSSQYPENILFETTQDRCFILTDLKKGDFVEVFFNIRGREWTNPQNEIKYFNSFNVWKITKEDIGKSNGISNHVLDIDDELDEDILPF